MATKIFGALAIWGLAWALYSILSFGFAGDLPAQEKEDARLMALAIVGFIVGPLIVILVCGLLERVIRDLFAWYKSEVNCSSKRREED